MNLPFYASFIDGQTVDIAPSAFDLVTPQDGKIIARIAEASREGVDVAVKAAGAAFARHRKEPTHARVGWLKAAAKALLGATDEIAATTARMSASRFEWPRSRCAAGLGS